MIEPSTLELADAARQPDSPSTRRMKRVLLGGFGGLVLLLGALGALSAWTVRSAAHVATEKTTTYISHLRPLSDARAGVNRASASLHGYLMDPNEATFAAHGADARRLWQGVPLDIGAYEAMSSATDTAPLRRALAAANSSMERALAIAGAARNHAGYEFLAAQWLPARDRLLAEIETLAQADRDRLQESMQQAAIDLRQLQNGLWAAIALSIVFGLALAAVAFRYLVRLEGLAADRYRMAREAAARSEQLSHRLITVQEQSRKALARELHDEVGQTVGALLMELGQARAEVGAGLPEARGHLDAAIASGEQVMRSVRDISLLLRPSMLDELGLVPALHWQAREISRRSGILTTVQADDEELSLNEELRTTVFRVVQEALQNAARHSGARKAEVTVAARQGNLHIVVADDGRGFEPSRTRGLGMLGMEERVARLGGTLRVASAPGQGVTLTADLPMPPPDPSRKEETV